MKRNIFIGIVASILIHPLAFGILFAIVAGLTMWEFYSITDNNTHNRLFGTIAAVLLFVCCFVIGYCGVRYTVLGLYAMFIIGVLVAELFRKADNPIHNWAYLLLGQVMVALPQETAVTTPEALTVAMPGALLE